MTNENVRKCDDCGVGLDGECYVDGPLLLCTPCAENLDYEREMEAFPEEYEGEDVDAEY